MLIFYDLLKYHHGLINKIYLSYAKRESPLSIIEYEKWYNETNIIINIDMDLHHSDQTLNNYNQLKPYFKLKVNSWDLYQKDNAIILEVSLH